MATAFKMAYNGADTAVTITLNSLASSATAGRESLVIDNSSNLDLDIQVYAKFTPQAGAPANDKGVYVFVYGLAGTAGNYPDNLTGTDAAVTPTSEGNLNLLGFVNIVTTTTLGAKFLGGIAGNLGGMPQKFGFYVRNYCGFALNASSGNALNYNRIQTQSV